MNDASTDQTERDATTQPPDDKPATVAAENGVREAHHAPNDSRRRDGAQRRDAGRGNHGPGPGPGQRYENRDGTFPFERTTVRFAHGATVSAFDRWYDRYRNSFYHVTAVLQRLNLDDGLDLVQDYLQTMLDEALSALREGKREVVAALEAKSGSRDYKLMVHQPAEREARVPSYSCRQYLDVFRALDDYLNAVVYAESVGAISWRDRRTLFMNAPRHVSTIAVRFMSVGTKLSMHDLQQAASAFDALRAIVAASSVLKSVQEPRSLALGQSTDVAPRVAESQMPMTAESAPAQADSPTSEPSVAKTPRRRKANDNASAPAALPGENQWA